MWDTTPLTGTGRLLAHVHVQAQVCAMTCNQSNDAEEVRSEYVTPMIVILLES